MVLSSYNYNWNISGSGYYDQDTGFSPYTITRAFNTPGTKVFSLNVNYGDHTNGIGNATCTATVDVQSENENSLNVIIEGNGTVTSNPTPLPVINTRVSNSYSYKVSDTVTLRATPDAGGSFTWGGYCAGTPSANPCVVSMSQSRTVNVVFTNVPQYCLAVRYNQGNRMTVNYQTQNLEVAHDSTRAVVEVRDNDPNSPNPVGGVPITLNINPLYTRADYEGQPRPEVKMTSSSVPVGGSTDVWIYFPTDGQPDSGFASPYSIPGNYVFALNQGSGIGPCNPGDPSPRINFTYIDVREREQ